MATSGFRIVSVLILILAEFSLGTGVHAENSTFLTYDDTQEGFSIAYPEGAALLYAADEEMQELSVLTPKISQ